MAQRSVVPFRSSQPGISIQSGQLSPWIQGSLDQHGDAVFAAEEIAITTLNSRNRIQVHAVADTVNTISTIAALVGSTDQLTDEQIAEVQRQVNNLMYRTGIMLEDTFDELDDMRAQAVRGLAPPPNFIDQVLAAVQLVRNQRREW